MNLPDFLTQGTYGEIDVKGHRIGLKHIVDCYNDGCSPAMIVEEYPTLALETVQKVVAFYLQNKAEIDAYVVEYNAELDRQQAAAKKGPDLAELRRRMEAMSRSHGK
jgi:uncharacterized protein (DUF433 family)